LKKVLFLLNILTLKSFAVSELYNNNEEINEVLNSNPFEPNYFIMLLGLFFVIGLVYLTGFVYQKLTKVKISDVEVDKYKPEIISTTSLGQNKQIHVVKVMNDYILIGSTQNNISFLKNLEETNRNIRGY